LVDDTTLFATVATTVTSSHFTDVYFHLRVVDPGVIDL